MASVICAYKFISPEAASVTTLVGMIVNLMLGRGDGGGNDGQGGASGSGPNLKVIAGGAAAALIALVFATGTVIAVAACGAGLAAVDDSALLDENAKLADCRSLARDVASADGGTTASGQAAYDNCKADGGL